MAKKTNVPEIRFAGFTDPWEQRKLSELTTMHARIGWQNLRTSEFFDSGNYYLITGTDFENGYVNLSTCHYVNKDRYDQDPNIQIDNGSILITKDGTLGKVALVQGLDKPATLNAGVFNVVIRNEEIVDNGYLYQYLKAPFLLNYVAQTATGGTIKHLNQNILVDFPVSMPSKGEQELIGDAFLRLDNLITLHQRKYDKLCAVKKSMLDKIFPKPGEVEPEIRFAGFTDPWEQRKLGELGFAQSGIGFPNTEQGGTEGTPFFKVSDMNMSGNEHELVASNNYVTPEQISRMGWHPINQVPAIFFAKVGAAVMLNRKRLVNKPFLMDNNTMAFSMDSSLLNTQFGQLLFDRLDLTSLIQVGALPSYNLSDVESITVSLPSTMDEQCQIGECLCNINDLITLHQRELNLLKNTKKSLLDKMFV